MIMKKYISPIIIFMLIVGGGFGLKFSLPSLADHKHRQTSDASRRIKGTIHVDGDDWAGYFIARSPEFLNAMRRAGYIVKYHNDKADYQTRMEKLKRGEIQFAVATVDSYILNASDSKIYFPGTIVMVIDESKGGDAILANTASGIKSLGDLKGKKNVKVAMMLDSPSHHLAKAANEHFDIPEILPTGSLLISTSESDEALRKLESGDADVAIGWEPFVSKTLTNGKGKYVKILGTEDTAKLIVDILLVNRDFADDNPAVVKLFMTNYFKTLKKYRDDEELLIKDLTADLKKYTRKKFSRDEIKSLLDGIDWANFSENCDKWFGIESFNEMIFDTITSTVKILVNAGDFKSDPLPDQTPYSITRSDFLESIFEENLTQAGFTAPGAGGTADAVEDSLTARFTLLDEVGWKKLKVVSSLKPIYFQSGKSDLDLISKRVIDEAVERLSHYPNYRVIIEGHTAKSRSEEGEKRNIQLSFEKSEAVATYLEITYNIDPNRLLIKGLGGSKPLRLKQGETKRSRAYKARCSRVEFVLVKESF